MECNLKKLVSLSIVFMLLYNSNRLLASADITWDAGGGTNRYWTTAANWDKNKLPTDANRAVLDMAGKIVTVKSGTTVAINKILGPQNTIAGSMYMYVYGTLNCSSYWYLGGGTSGVGQVSILDGDVSARDMVIGRNGGTGAVYIDNSSYVEIFGSGAPNSYLGFQVPGTGGGTGTLNILGDSVVYAKQLGLRTGGTVNLSENAELFVDRIDRIDGGGTITIAGNAKLHTIIAYDDANFFAWPANEGVWQWQNGNEILVQFIRAGWVDRAPEDNNHHWDAQETRLQARSLDGGLSWSVSVPQYGYIGTAGTPGNINYTGSGFAFKARNGDYWYSINKGNKWSNDADFPSTYTRLRSRTDYIVESSSIMKVFLSEYTEGCDINTERPYCTVLREHGLNWDRWRPDGVVKWMDLASNPPTEDNEYSTMPSTVKLGTSHSYITAVRRSNPGGSPTKWIEIRRSDNDCNTWYKVGSNLGIGANNPPCLVKLTSSGKRLCLTYGNRAPADGSKSIEALISNNYGQTWSSPIILRNDGLNWDIGYVRSVFRSDGSDGVMVTIYYFCTEDKEQQHIAATLWRPPAE